MDVESNASEEYLVFTTKKDRLKHFCKLYWRILLIIGAAFFYLPVAFMGTNRAYPCFYIFLLTTTYWIFDVMHPGVVAMVPVGLSTLFGYYFDEFVDELHIHNNVLNCLGVMMMIVAIEYSKVHRRVALKILLVFGCSHYMLSFLLFFTSMFLSMWVTSTMACGLMIPVVKALLFELEKMGILEVYYAMDRGRKEKYLRHEQSKPRSTDFTIFYFLGIAYSSSIGALGTLIGSYTNKISKYYSEAIFPYAPKLEFPHYMLLNLPGVLLMETLLYFWMNIYFMGMFRAHSEIALEIGMTEEEAEYIHTLLSTQYHQLGKITFHEIIVTIIVVLTIVLHISRTGINSHNAVSSPIIFCAALFFIIPTNLDFLKFFRKHSAGSCMMFESLKTSRMTDEFDKVIFLIVDWPASLQVLVIIITCKILSEFANSSCVLYTLMPCVAKLSIAGKVNPHYLMSAATLSCSVPFHMLSGAPHYALVLEFIYIHPWKMMQAGIGPSVIAVLVMWFTVTLWSRTIWPDITVYPRWADKHHLNFLKDETHHMTVETL